MHIRRKDTKNPVNPVYLRFILPTNLYFPGLLSAMQVPFLQNPGVMDDVPHGKVRQGPDREWVVTGNPAARPGIRRQGSKESHRRRSDRLELFHDAIPRAIICARSGGGDCLVETGQLALEPARKPERAKHTQALGVTQVIHDLTNVPLARSIAMQRANELRLSRAAHAGGRACGWLPSRLIPHRHRPRAELQPAYELQVDMLR